MPKGHLHARLYWDGGRSRSFATDSDKGRLVTRLSARIEREKEAGVHGVIFDISEGDIVYRCSRTYF